MPGGFIPHPISGLPEAWSLAARVGGNACLRWGWGGLPCTCRFRPILWVGAGWVSSRAPWNVEQGRAGLRKGLSFMAFPEFHPSPLSGGSLQR